MARKTVKRIRKEVENLSAAHVDSESRQVDWSDTLGDGMDGWRSYDAVTCPECNKTVCVVGPTGECRHSDVDDDADCGGYLNSDGPVMNYFYPCNVSRPEKAAISLSGAVCIVQMADGETGFALTGGGMDLSWDIAAAYVECGFLPPAWIRLPDFGGLTLTTRTRTIIEACKRSAEIMAERARWSVGDLERLEKRMRAEARARKARKTA